MDDLDNITLQAHVQIDKFKLDDPRRMSGNEGPSPITIEIPTKKAAQRDFPQTTVAEPPKRIEKPSSPPNEKRLSPQSLHSPTSPEITFHKQQPDLTPSAPKIIKSSVGRPGVKSPPSPLSPVSPPIPGPLVSPNSQRKEIGNASQLSALKNTMRENMEKRSSPSPTKIEPGDLMLTSDDEEKPKKVEFQKNLGTVEGTNQSVKEWSQTPERKTANIMAEIRKKISKKQKDEEKRDIPEAKEIQVIIYKPNRELLHKRIFLFF